MMLIHLRNTKGLKKALDQIKTLDNDAEVKDYEFFVSVRSDNLNCYVSRDVMDDKLCLIVYVIETKEDTKIPGTLIDTIY